MNNDKHTPGPWSLMEDIYVDKYEKNSEQGKQVVELVHGVNMTPEEKKANARLIAAAPDILEALQDSVKFFWRFTEYDRETMQAKKPDHPVFKWEKAISTATQTNSHY